MRIVTLVAENIKKIKAINLMLENGVVVFSGPNGAGKSSAVDTVFYALGGKDALPGKPVRSGQDKAKITLGLGTDKVELVVKRTISKDGSATLVVETHDGMRYQSPQTMLDGIWNSLAVDPQTFSRMPLKEQAIMLRRVVKLEIDIDALDAANKTDFDARTNINRDAKTKKSQAEGIVLPQHPGVKVDDAALVDAMQSAGEHNASIVQRKGMRDAAQQAVERDEEQATRDLETVATIRVAANVSHKRAYEEAQAAYDRAVKSAEAALSDELARATSLERTVCGLKEKAQLLRDKLTEAEPLPEAIDVTELRAKITAAQETNRAVDAYVLAAGRKGDLETDYKALEAKSEALTKAIDERKEAKDKAIRGAAMPVPGLSFADGVVTFNGLPFDQASQAEQLRVSMAIALAANPKLKVVCIREGSLLDVNSMALVAEMAEAAGAQVLMERVDDSGKVGIVFTDGEVSSTPESRAKEAAP